MNALRSRGIVFGVRIVLAAVCLDTAATAVAQSWTLEPAAQAQIMYSDNARYGGGGPAAADTLISGTGTLTIHGRSPRVRLDGTVSLDAVHYMRSTQSDQLIPVGSIALNAILVEDVAGVDSSVTAQQLRVNPFGAASQGPAVDVVTGLRFRLSPYVDHKFSPFTSLYARSDNVWSKVSGTDASAVPLSGSLIQEDVVRFDVKPDPVGVTFEGRREDTRFRGESQSALTIEALRAVGWLGFDREQAVGVVAGQERTEFILTEATDPIYGVRFRLKPGAEGYLNGSIERRFFGTGWNIELGERSTGYAFSANLRRGPFTFPAALGLVPANGNVADVLDAALASRYPDPVVRARAVQDLILTRGLPSNLSMPFTIYSGNAQLNQSVDASFAIVGSRTTVTLFALHSRVEGLLRRDAGQSYTPSFSTDNSQDSAGFNINHRLTPLSNLDLTADVTRLAGLGSLSTNRSRTVLLRANVVTALSPRTTGTAGLRRQRLVSTVAADDDETAAYISLAHRF